MKSIVALFSGEGTNLLNLIQKIHLKEIQIVGAITNNPNSPAIEKVREANIPVIVLDHKHYSSRELYDAELVKLINTFSPDLVVLCGFMRILTSIFTHSIQAINLHPSLLPLFKGANAIETSFYSTQPNGGISIHWVSEELDGGDIISQASFVKESNETLETFTTKIHELEYEFLPKTIIEILKDN